jgi:hypothetical protein
MNFVHVLADVGDKYLTMYTFLESLMGCSVLLRLSLAFRRASCIVPSSPAEALVISCGNRSLVMTRGRCAYEDFRRLGAPIV